MYDCMTLNNQLHFATHLARRKGLHRAEDNCHGVMNGFQLPFIAYHKGILYPSEIWQHVGKLVVNLNFPKTWIVFAYTR